jgi:large subunit ribosomal protein L25
MVDIRPLVAESRDRAGKGAARATRRAGRVPAVIYGNKLDPVMISMNPIELVKELRTGLFFSRVFEIEVDGKTERVLPRDVQFHPVTDNAMHVDFMRFSKKTKFAVEVTVDFINEEEAPGLKRGGVLNVVRHAVELLCSPDNIPESIVGDLTGMDIGDSLHISQFTLPEGVAPTITDRDFTVATIAAPSVEELPEDEEDEAIEGEEGEEGAEGEGEEGAEEASED